MNLKKVINSAMKNIKRGGWFTLTSVIVMTLTFFVTSVFIIAGYISMNVLKYLESKAQITAFFKDSVTEEQIKNIQRNLESSPLIEGISYISKEDALKIYVGQHKDEPLLLESISSSIFPASLDVRAKRIEDLPQVAGMLEKTEGVEEVVYYKDIIATFESWSKTARLVGISLISILSIISILVVLVTITTAIRSKSEEIIIMRLVGASSWHIRGPFLVQGIFYGIISALFSFILIASILPFLLPYMNTVFKGIPLPNINVVTAGALLGIELTFGIVLGALGSLVSVSKYLKV